MNESDIALPYGAEFSKSGQPAVATAVILSYHGLILGIDLNPHGLDFPKEEESYSSVGRERSGQNRARL